MCRSILALLLCAHVVAAEPAPEEAGHPSPYWLAGRLDGITAKLTVRYHLATVGPSGDNRFELVLPDNGVVTGATVVADGIAHRLAFSAADAGSAEFDAVLAKSAGPRRRWEVMIESRFSSSVEVHIAAPRAAVLTLDLEIEAPTCFSHGARYASIDPAWRPSLDRALHTIASPPEGCVARPDDEGATGVDKAWIAFAADDGHWRPSGADRVVMRGERVDVEHGHFARVELNLASELADVPPDLHTVFVVDGSLSLRDSEREAQIKIIQSYLQHAPNTQIQIVAFARKARALLPGWTRAGDARLAALAALAPANGSNVDTGLVEAAAWLARTEGARRVVLFGDERLGKRVAGLGANVLRGVVPAGTLVHVVALDAPPPPAAADRREPPRSLTAADAIVRADDIAFAELARSTEGLAARGAVIDGRVDATKLVKPIALEQVAVHTTGWVAHAVDANEPACTGDLAQGSACAWFGVAEPTTNVAPTIAVDGLLWNHPVHRTITPDPGQRERLARMLTGFMANLGDAEHDLQVLAHAVNQAWVLYGAWGADDGYADDGFSDIYGGVCGCGPDGGIAGFGFGSAPKLHASGPSIAAQLARATAACHVDAHVDVALELTESEIVDVAVTAPRADLRDCVTEAVWNTLLFVAEPQPHAFETVALGS